MENYLGFKMEDLKERGRVHDKNKFSKKEKLGYIYLTWFHHMKSKGESYNYPPKIEETVKQVKKNLFFFSIFF